MDIIIDKITNSEKNEGLSHLSMTASVKTKFGLNTTKMYMWVMDTELSEGDTITVSSSDFTSYQKEMTGDDGVTRVLTYLKPSVF